MLNKLQELKQQFNQLIDSYINEEEYKIGRTLENEENEENEEKAFEENEDKAFDTLKTLLESSDWPAAVDPTLICDPTSELDKLNRAEGIVELLIEESLKEKKFLDYGCGEGHITNKASSQGATISVGFDIKQYNWENLRNDKVILTTDINEVEKNQPYDIILIYDVIDHASPDDASKILTTCSNLLNDNGTIYLRTHPYCSRHATHLYQQLNKAYAHLIFTDEELEHLGHETPNETHLKIFFPIRDYNKLIKNANLKSANSNVLRERIEPFFMTHPLIKKRMMSHYKMEQFPTWQYEQQFLDYILKKN